MVYPFLPVIARGLGVPLSQAGYLVSARWIAGMATPGVIATVGKGEVRRRVIVFGTTLFIVGALVTAATSVYIGALAGFAMMGLAKPTYDVASQSYISDRVPYASRARYLAVYELAWAGSLLVGAPFAGWLIARGDWETPFWVLGGLATIGLLLVNRFIDPDRPHAGGTTPRLHLEEIGGHAARGHGTLHDGGRSHVRRVRRLARGFVRALPCRTRRRRPPRRVSPNSQVRGQR